MKNRHFANRTLLCVFLLYAAVVVLRALYGRNFYIDWAMFVLEASLVGGIADWFAVTALFKRPLGLPLKATAIIPNNREKVIDAVTGMVENNLFTADGILEKLRDSDIADALIRYIDGHNLIDAWSELALTQLAQPSKQEELRRMLPELETGIKAGLSRINLSARVDDIVRWFLGYEKNEAAAAFLLDSAIGLVQGPKVRQEIRSGLDGAIDSRIGQMDDGAGLLARLAYHVATYTDCVNTEEAAQSLQASFCETLEEMKNPGHPVRAELDATLLGYASRLETNAAWQTAIERYKEEIVSNFPVGAELQKLFGDLCGALKVPEEDGGACPKPAEPDLRAEHNLQTESNLRMEANLRMERIKYRINRLWDSVKQSEALKAEADALIKSLLFDFVRSESKVIGELVRDALNAFSNERLSDFVQDKVGDDLQWIRVNGSFVGGIVGAALYLFLNFAYLPLLHQFG